VDFLVTLQRGTEWAATGSVTQKIPSDFPGPDSVSFRTNLAAMDRPQTPPAGGRGAAPGGRGAQASPAAVPPPASVTPQSYSPEQVVSGFWEKAVMPVIFAELAAHYRPAEVSDPNSPAAAANGQYILIRREAYDAIGGHAAVADKILEDVELARAVKRSGRKILFRFGADAVRTRMYRNFSQLREGWTKNLAILFPSAAWLAAWRFSEFLALVLSLALLILFVASRQFLVAPLFLVGPVFTFRRIARAHFPWSANFLAFLGIPLFSYLLVRSKLSHQRGRVAWKGREYSEPRQNLAPDHSPRIVRKLS